MRRALLILPLALAAASPAAAQEGRSSDQLMAAAELIEGGGPLYRRLFEYGWPTDPVHRRLTNELTAAPGSRLIKQLLEGGPELGRPVSSSYYLRLRFEEAKGSRGPKVREPADVVADDVAKCEELTGGRVGRVNPVLLPYQGWGQGKPTHDLAGLAAAMLAEVAYAEDQLGRVHADERGRESWGGSADEAALALVALNTALAQAWEISQLPWDRFNNSIRGHESAVDIDPERHYLPHTFSSDESGAGELSYKAKGRNESLAQLEGPALLLVAVSRLARLFGPDQPRSTTDALGRGGGNLGLLAKGKVYDDLVGICLYVFRSLRNKHMNVREGKAVTTADGTTIDTRALGAFLDGIRCFHKFVVYPTGRDGKPVGAHAELLVDEQRKAVVLLRELTRKSLLVWERQSAGFWSSYSITTNGATRNAKKTMDAQGWAIRGLLAAHDGLAGDNRYADTRRAALEAALASIRWLDQQMWNSRYGGYVADGGSSVDLGGAISIVSALRQLALVTRDGRFLLRYRQFLTRLHEAGLEKRRGLAGELSFK